MRLLGRYRELGYLDAPSALEHLDVVSNRRTVARYLEDGVVVFHVPEMILDPLDPARVLGSGDIMTDGEWIWTSALSGLVRRHGVALDPAFLSQATRGLVGDFDVTAATAEVAATLGLVASVEPGEWWIVEEEGSDG